MGSVATYLEILHSMIQDRRGSLGEAVWGHKGFARSMSGGPVGRSEIQVVKEGYPVFMVPLIKLLIQSYGSSLSLAWFA